MFYMRNNIKLIRDRLGLSQAAFAVGIDVSQGNVSHYEMQRQDVPPDVARRVISFANSKGHSVSFNDVYCTGETAQHQDAV